MAAEKKTRPAGAKKEKVLSDKKRLGYLKLRAQDLRAEIQAVKKETGELRKKLGVAKKGAAEGDGNGGGE